MSTTRRMAEIIAFHSGKSVAKVERDIDRDFYMTAEEARSYGLVEEIITPRRGVSSTAERVAAIS